MASILISAHALGFTRPDEVAAVFCGSQKSLVTGVPIANVSFSAGTIGPVLLPLMIYYPIQLLVCAWLAQRYAARTVLFPANLDGITADH